MALRKQVSLEEPERLFGWDPSANVEDGITVGQDVEFDLAFKRRLWELGRMGHTNMMTPVRFIMDGRPREVGPDFYAVGGCEERDREFWESWKEGGRLPDLIVEFLSKRNIQNDRLHKMRLYASVFKTPEYYLYDPKKGLLEGYRLTRAGAAGHRYVRMREDENGRVPCRLIEGSLGIYRSKLRVFRHDGTLVPTDKEAADAAEQRAESAEQRADSAEQRAEALRREVERLRRQIEGSG
ncbi:MAG: Uma2 family endonuclease [Candidatus Xenobia bacterium]